jgi:mRNA deadenylase 3'-5' endonuclease subunit Ccr4
MSFSIATFNILTQTLINRAAFPFASKIDLKAKPRHPLVLKELFALNADILCLQEVADIHRCL